MIIINNTTAGATNAGVIDMQPGEYLMDVINAINALPENEKPTESNVNAQTIWIDGTSILS